MGVGLHTVPRNGQLASFFEVVVGLFGPTL